MLPRLSYVPRAQFVPFHMRKERYAILVCHRRAGKTYSTVADLLDTAIRCELKNPQVAYVAPFQNQARAISWKIACGLVEGIEGVKINETMMTITFPHNNGEFKVIGGEKVDSLRGNYYDAIALDEFADMRPGLLAAVVRPALSDRKGKLIIMGTPKGEDNDFYGVWEQAQTDDEWYSVMLKASETGLVDDEELAANQKLQSENLYAQEWECSFSAALEGAIYGPLLEKARDEERIGDIPYRPDLPVFTAWDIGVKDDTSIVFAQRVGGWIHIIDHYAANRQAASHYVDLIKSKPYNYGLHIFPHDIDRHDGWVNPVNRIDTMRNLGVQPLKVAPNVKVMEGIEAVRVMMPTMRFNKDKCQALLASLRNYQFEYDDKRRVWKKDPLHNFASHDADAMRYLCVGLEPERAPVTVPRYSQARRRQYANASTNTSAWTA